MTQHQKNSIRISEEKRYWRENQNNNAGLKEKLFYSFNKNEIGYWS